MSPYLLFDSPNHLNPTYYTRNPQLNLNMTRQLRIQVDHIGVSGAKPSLGQVEIALTKSNEGFYY